MKHQLHGEHVVLIQLEYCSTQIQDGLSDEVTTCTDGNTGAHQWTNRSRGIYYWEFMSMNLSVAGPTLYNVYWFLDHCLS